jgi:hypothetical protein
VAPTVIEVDASLHPAQEEVWSSPARFRVVACGRRFGKTHLGVLEVIHHGLTVEGGVIWWVAPVHEQTDIAFRMFLEAVPPELIEVNLTKKLVIFKSTGTRLHFKSADRDKNLRGEGLTFIVVDEGAFIKEGTWYGALRPSLSDRKGAALLIGTFDGDENYFYQEWEQGQNDPTGEYESWRFPTAANPYIDPAEIEAAKRRLPKAEFEQEYMANPLSRVGAVFDGEDVQVAIELGRNITYVPRTFDTYAGLDWGFANPTALEVCEQTPDDYVRWVQERLWHSVELNERCYAIALIAKKLGIKTIYADAAGADENVTLAKHLKDLGVKCGVKPVPFNKYKETGITARRWFLENKREMITPACKQLAIDTKRYRYKEGQDGVIKDDVEKRDDHTVDACTAFFATRFPQVAGRKL